MTLFERLEQKNMSMYRLAKQSDIPYTTINDICKERVRLERCSAETVYKLAQALEVSIEELLEPYVHKRSNFENYKSAICHRLKELGDRDFVMDTLQSDNIRKLFDRKWYPESLYLLAMLDYISRENNIPICEDYDDIRMCRLETPLYPAGVCALSIASKDNAYMRDALETAIPEFLRFNIIECDVRDII